MRCGCFLLIATIALFVFGFQAVRDAAAFQKPKVMACDAFVKNPPKEGWYQLKGCVLDLPSAAFKIEKSKYSTGEGTLTEAYVPVYSQEQMKRRAALPEGAPDPEKTGLILATEDESILTTMREIHALDSKGQAETDAYLEKNGDKLWIKRDLEGMVRSGVNADDSTRKEIAGLTEAALPNFVVMQEGWKPNMGMGLAMLGGGVVMGIVTLVFLAGMFKKED
jgi:hypothetical protein